MDMFDLEKIAEMNGRDGKPSYVVFEARVYDVSASKLWKNGTHMRIHQAGGDLSARMASAPHGPEVLERYPQVGSLRVVKAQAPEQEAVRTFSILDRYPFLRRHPHPMMVHFPIALFILTTLFYIAYPLSGIASLETTAFQCLAAGLCFMPLAMGTGYLTWHLNYEARPIRAVRNKIVLSWFLLALSGTALAWRIVDPGIAFHGGVPLYAYSIMLFLLAPVVTAIGYYGGQLTMPWKI